MSIDTEILDENDTERGMPHFVYEKSNRISAAWKFLRENNRRITKDVKGIDIVVARTLLLLNYPNAYMISFLMAEYSPQNMGYKF